MMKVKFHKCLCSHGVVLCAYTWNDDCVAEFIPLYGQFCLFDKSFSWLENIMRSYHFDHQFYEIDRWRALHEFLIRKKKKENELKAKMRYEKLQRNVRTA